MSNYRLQRSALGGFRRSSDWQRNLGAVGLPGGTILIDAMLPRVGCCENPLLNDLNLVFSGNVNDGFRCVGWKDGENVVVDASEINAPSVSYAPVSFFSQYVESYAAMMAASGTANDSSQRYLKMTITYELTPPSSQPWTLTLNDGTHLAGYGTTDKYTIVLTMSWDPQSHPFAPTSIGATCDKVGAGGEFYHWLLNEDGSVTETCTSDGLRYLDLGFWGNPTNIVDGLESGGTLYAAKYETVNQSMSYVNGNRLTFDWSHTTYGRATAVVSVKREIPHTLFPLDSYLDSPNLISCHDAVQELLDGIDLTNGGRGYTFHESGGCYPASWYGPGTEKTVVLREKCYYYIIPFWVVNPETGQPTRQRRFDILEVELWPNIWYNSDPARYQMIYTGVVAGYLGSGFTVGQVLTATGGMGSVAAQIRITSIGSGGSATGVEIVTPGNYSVVPDGTQAFGNTSGALFYCTTEHIQIRNPHKDSWWVDNLGYAGQNGAIGVDVLRSVGVGMAPAITLLGGYDVYTPIEDLFPSELPSSDPNSEDFNTNLLLKIQRRVRMNEGVYAPRPTYHLSKARVDERADSVFEAKCCLLQYSQYWGRAPQRWPYYPDWTPSDKGTLLAADGGTVTHDVSLRNNCQASFRTGLFEFDYKTLSPLVGASGGFGVLMRKHQAPWSETGGGSYNGPWDTFLDNERCVCWPMCCNCAGGGRATSPAGRDTTDAAADTRTL